MAGAALWRAPGGARYQKRSRGSGTGGPGRHGIERERCPSSRSGPRCPGRQGAGRWQAIRRNLSPTRGGRVIVSLSSISGQGAGACQSGGRRGGNGERREGEDTHAKVGSSSSGYYRNPDGRGGHRRTSGQRRPADQPPGGGHPGEHSAHIAPGRDRSRPPVPAGSAKDRLSAPIRRASPPAVGAQAPGRERGGRS
jgi:hypothetical protein